MPGVLVVGGAYLVGSIPFAYLLSRRRGIDLRRVGSGNLGASNVLRATGVGRAVAVLLLDASKGAAAVLLAGLAGAGELSVVAGLAAVAGHVFPVWLGFRGGKGVATAAGAFAVLAPGSVALAAGTFVAAVWVSRYISVGSLAGAGTLVVSTAARDGGEVAMGALVAAVIVAGRHRGNVARLRRGTERRVGLRLPAPSAEGHGDA